MHVTTELRCEIKTLAYPPAALFGLAMAIVAYNALAVIKATLGRKRGRDGKGDGFIFRGWVASRGGHKPHEAGSKSLGQVSRCTLLHETGSRGLDDEVLKSSTHNPSI
ncbi:hypothetical protein CKO23_24800 [Thiocystis violacea]|nr:hypothetical protein [Thiocystis violacea]